MTRLGPSVSVRNNLYLLIFASKFENDSKFLPIFSKTARKQLEFPAKNLSTNSLRRAPLVLNCFSGKLFWKA